MSDLHLEFAPMTVENSQNADVLVLAGDVCVADHFTRGVDSPYAPKAAAYRQFFESASKTFPEVIYIMGNHEHYHGDFNTTKDILKATGLDGLPNVTLLDNEAKIIDGVVFVGGTMWTDFDEGNPLAMETVRQGLNDYHCVRNRTRKLIPMDTLSQFNRFRSLLAGCVHDFTESHKIVVVSHHAPSYQSCAPEYRGSPLNPGYASNLDRMIESNSINLWIHGHMHCSNDYTIGDTRIVSNPRGYHDENLNFDSTIVVEL